LYLGSPEQVLGRLLDIAIQFAWGLKFAHERGIVHQDVKPANLMLAKNGVSKVTDFGMAQAKDKLLVREGASNDQYTSNGNENLLVDTIGLTPAYCSPEQQAGQPLSRRTDIYSWAVSVIEMFLGKRTWETGPACIEALDQYLEQKPVYSGKPVIPASMFKLLRSCLSKDPEERPDDMGIVVNNLRSIYQVEMGKDYLRPEPHIRTTLADTLNNRGVSMADLGNDEEAIQLFDEARQAETIHPTAIYNRGLTLWHRGEITDLEAIADLEENEKNLTDTSQSVLLTSLLHLERGDNVTTVRILEEALQTYFDRPALQRMIGTAKRTLEQSGRCLKTFGDHDSPVNAVAITSDGEYLIGGGNDNAVRVWRVESGECEKVLSGHSHLIQSIALSPDDKFLLSGSWDHTLRLWDLENGESVHVFEGHNDIIQAVAFTPDGDLAVSASSDASLRVWALDTGEELRKFSGHIDTVSAMAISADGQRLISASFDNTIRVWQLDSGECTKTIQWVRSPTSNIVLTSDGSKALLAGADAQLWMVDLEEGTSIKSFRGHSGTVKTVQIVPDQVWALSGATDGTLRLWELETGRCLRTYSGHTSAVNAVAVCSKEDLAVTGSSDATVRLWRLSCGDQAPHMTVLPRSSEEVSELTDQIESQMELANQKFKKGDYRGALAMVGQAREIPGYQQNPRLLSYWDRIGRMGVRQALRSSWLAHTFPPHPAGINSVAFTGDGKFILSAGKDRQIYCWDLGSGQRERELYGHADDVSAVKCAKNVNVVLSGSMDGWLNLWQLSTGKCITMMSGHTSSINAVDLSFDGHLAISGSNDHTLRVWRLPSGQCLRVLSGHDHYVRGAVLSPGMRQAVSVSWDRTLRVWDIVTGKCLKVIEGHTEAIDALAVSPDGAYAITGGLDHTIVLWNLISGEAVKVIEGISTRILSLVFSVDQRFIFSGEIDGTINVWRLLDGHSVKRFVAHTGPVNSLDVSADGRLLASVSSDRFLKIWRLDWDYNFPTDVSIDRTAQSYLLTFLAQHRPYTPTSIAPSGKPVWDIEDFKELMVTLSYRGYGGVPPGEVNNWLKRLAQRIR
jgi:WD40 repeat protein